MRACLVLVWMLLMSLRMELITLLVALLCQLQEALAQTEKTARVDAAVAAAAEAAALRRAEDAEEDENALRSRLAEAESRIDALDSLVAAATADKVSGLHFCAMRIRQLAHPPVSH